MAKKRNTNQQDDTLVDIVEVKEQAQDFFEKNKNYLIAGIIALFAIVAGVYGYYNFYKAPREDRAMKAFSQPLEMIQQDSFAKALVGVEGAFKGFANIAEEFSGTSHGNLAKYFAGVASLRIGNYDNALKYLKSFSPGGKITPAMTYGMIGDAYSELKDVDQAMSYYEKAARANANKFSAPYFLLKAGLWAEENSQKDKALAYFKEIKEKYPDSIQGEDIDIYIGRVGKN